MARPPTVAEPILDGQVLLYTRPDSAVFQIRFKLGRKWIHVSTGRKDKEEAVKQSYDIFYAYKVKDSMGVTVTSKTFESIAKTVADDLLKTGKSQDKTYSNYIKNRWVPFFKGKYINNITSDDFEAFFADLESKMGQSIKNITRRQHYVAINRVYDKAVSLKHITRGEIPDMPMKKESDAKSDSRPAFYEKELPALVNGLYNWISKGVSKRDKEKRFVLYHYIKVLLATGIRPGTESESILFDSINVHIDGQNGNRYVVIRVAGKTGERFPVAAINVFKHFEAVKNTIKDVKGDTPFLSIPTGKPLSDPQALFKEFLTEHGLLVDKVTGDERTLYSCRHTYITMQLLHGTSIYTIANQCGNSVQMIEEYYSKVKPLMSADAILKATANVSQTPRLPFFDDV